MTDSNARSLKESPSQTAGPYVHIGLTPNFLGLEGVYAGDLGTTMVRDGALGQRISIAGRIFDGAGAPLRDALVEIWHADASGLYNSPAETRGVADPNVAGWGRSATDIETGEYRFETIKPGRAPMDDGRLQAPHISFWIVARGINLGLNTRMYFDDEAAANDQDPLLSRIEHRSRVATLIGRRSDDAGVASYQFDIRIQGPNETVFLEI